MYVTPTDILFDPVKLAADTSSIIDRYKTNINLRRHYSVSDAQGLTYGAGSLYDREQLTWIADEKEFNTPITYFNHMYIAEVLTNIELYVKENYNLSIGRARLLTLQRKSTLSLHTDYLGTIRFHVPIITNDSALFIHRNNQQYTVSTMSEVGRLYTFDASVEHTAINASQMYPRTHLVVVGC